MPRKKQRNIKQNKMNSPDEEMFLGKLKKFELLRNVVITK